MSRLSASRNLTSIHYIQRLSEQNVTYNSWGKKSEERLKTWEKTRIQESERIIGIPIDFSAPTCRWQSSGRNDNAAHIPYAVRNTQYDSKIRIPQSSFQTGFTRFTQIFIFFF